MQVWLSRMDGHMGVANSLALKIAGITNMTKDPVGGTIRKTIDGGEFLCSPNTYVVLCYIIDLSIWDMLMVSV